MLETNRLVLRRLSLDDAGFILELLNEPSFIRHVGDKGVRTRADAGRYIRDGPMASYERLGFGLYLVESKERSESMGICGLLKRETLEHVDLGFAFLPRFWSLGYAFESASAVLAHARDTCGLGRIVAIASQDNAASHRLLVRLGFRFDSTARLSEAGQELAVFASEPRPGRSGQR